MDSGNEEPLTGGKRCRQFFKNYYKIMIVGIAPLVFLPIILLDNTPAHRCMFCVAVIAVYWLTEALPLAVSSLIPIVVFPLMGIMGTKDTCRAYFNDTVALFLAGIVMAHAIEFSNLHNRLALATISCIGCSVRRLFLGFTLITALVSMWIVNTAATAMMIPVCFAVLGELEKEGLCRVYKESEEAKKDEAPKDQAQLEEQSKKPTDGEKKPQPTSITVFFFTGIAYASSIGGIATLIGTGTNLSFKGIYETKFPSQNIDFMMFIAYATPLMIVQLLLTDFLMLIFFTGLFRPKSKAAQTTNIGREGEQIARSVIQDRYKNLGPITAHEIAVIVLFIIPIILFFTKAPGFIKGWAELITDEKVGDATVGILVVVLYFIVPAAWTCLKFCKKGSDVPRKPSIGIVTWKYVESHFPWGLMFLLGGGFALAAGGDKTGMNKMLGNSLSNLKSLPVILTLLIVVVFCEAATQFSSNVAIANIVLPVLAEMALAVKVHPLYYMFPAALACSMAFLTVVGTPPNTIINGLAHISGSNLCVAGIIPTIVSVITIWVWAFTWGKVIFPETGEFPSWAEEAAQNSSAT